MPVACPTHLRREYQMKFKPVAMTLCAASLVFALAFAAMAVAAAGVLYRRNIRVQV